ncbi:hypothetical protein KBTX_00613 [wastewater metagenome]|uniref:Uncharacterized protein n=2 Tax=unclassified sequences TaxID=12908 RepID=A0A5B8RC01_9ZZZZ|nr:hypothetical protein KBTEX_00613 [uncultured organism]
MVDHRTHQGVVLQRGRPGTGLRDPQLRERIQRQRRQAGGQGDVLPRAATAGDTVIVEDQRGLVLLAEQAVANRERLALPVRQCFPTFGAAHVHQLRHRHRGGAERGAGLRGEIRVLAGGARQVHGLAQLRGQPPGLGPLAPVHAHPRQIDTAKRRHPQRRIATPAQSLAQALALVRIAGRGRQPPAGRERRGEVGHEGRRDGVRHRHHQVREPGVHRQREQPAAALRHRTRLVQRSDGLQPRPGGGKRVVRRRLGEFERRGIPPGARGGQHQLGEILADHLRRRDLGERRAFAPQAQAYAGGRSSGAPPALVRTGAGDRLQRQHGAAVAPHRAPLQAAVHHGGDAGHGERGLRHVGGENHPAWPLGAQRPALVRRRRARVQRDDLRLDPAERPRRVRDLPAAGEEHEHVPLRLRQGPLHCGRKAGLQLTAVGHPPGIVAEVVDAHGIGPARRLQQLGTEVARQALALNRRGGDDQPRPLRAGTQQRQEQVRVPAPLVELVQHDSGETGKPVRRQPAQGDTGCDEHHLAVRTVADITADGMAHPAAGRLAQVARDEAGQAGGREPARLDHQHPPLPPRPQRQPRGLARACGRGHHHRPLRQGGTEGRLDDVNGELGRALGHGPTGYPRAATSPRAGAVTRARSSAPDPRRGERRRLAAPGRKDPTRRNGECRLPRAADLRQESRAVTGRAGWPLLADR